MLKLRFNKKENESLESGFGSRVSDRDGQRLLNKDGSFNVNRSGYPFFRRFNTFNMLLTIPWWKFHVLILGSFIGGNIFFALSYMLIGIEGITGVEGNAFFEWFWSAFFFSIQTFTSVGYGVLSPDNYITNIFASLEAFVGLLSFALATGLLFARFSRPVAHIVFSNNAIITPFQDMKAFQFRIANGRKNQLIEVSAKLLISFVEKTGEKKIRQYYLLDLQLNKIVFLPLHWTIVHPIDKESPIYGLTETELRNSEAEFMIQITAIDDTFSQTVHTHSSYRYDEVKWDYKFADMFHEFENGGISVDLKKIHELVPLDEIKNEE